MAETCPKCGSTKVENDECLQCGVYLSKYRAYLFGAAFAGLAGGLFAIFISAFNPSAWAPQELLVIYAAILVGGRGNPRGVILGVFVIYIGLIELTRFLPSPASRPRAGATARSRSRLSSASLSLR